MRNSTLIPPTNFPVPLITSHLPLLAFKMSFENFRSHVDDKEGSCCRSNMEGSNGYERGSERERMRGMGGEGEGENEVQAFRSLLPEHLPFRVQRHSENHVWAVTEA